MHYRYIVLMTLCLSIAVPCHATNTSTADPTYPATFADIDSEPLRQQFDDLINDIDNLWAAIGPTFLEANQLFGALVSGKPVALPVPSCFGPTNALTWQPGAGIGCNSISTGSGVDGLAPAYTVLAGPLGGSPATASFRALTGNDLPLPTSNSIGGVESLAVVPHEFVTGISTSGIVSQAAPSFADISGTASPSQLPSPTASSVGGTQSISVVPHNFMTGISPSGVPTQAEPSFGDISGNISVSQMASGSGASAYTVWLGNGTWGAIPPPIPTTQTGNYTLQLADANGFIVMNCAAACAVTVPPNSAVAYQLGTELTIYQSNTGSASFALGAGVTINTPSTLTLLKQFSTASIKEISANVWVLAGAIQ
jgi:hypothetical protein